MNILNLLLDTLLLNLNNRKLSKIKLFIIFYILFLPYSRGTLRCQTEETCNVGIQCECIAAASSARGNYYYFNFPDIKKGALYQCKLDAAPSIVGLRPLESTFPAGIPNSYTEPYIHFPVLIPLSTENMLNEIDNLKLRVYVGASDTPATISAICRLSSSTITLLTD